CKLNAIAFDISPHWGEIISHRNTYIPFIIGDAENMQFIDNSFDFTICYNSLHHMDSVQKVVEECYRVLKPGGKAIFLEPGINHTDSETTKIATTRFDTIEHGINPFKLKKQCLQTGFSKSYIKSDYSIYPDINERHILTHFKGWIRDIILTPLFIIGSLKGRAFVVAQK
ncbi:MAG: class I SAM-dependent methyltransferase, partial [Candidatus Heimdallarchaeota archaeon]|nr:class I SAM-dependent methyltransferase [Candidatus Heimdallarchaeota archaeon]